MSILLTQRASSAACLTVFGGYNGPPGLQNVCNVVNNKALLLPFNFESIEILIDYRC